MATLPSHIAGINMQWINPRNQLPEEDQIIWIIRIENRSGEKGFYPSAEIKIGRAIKNKYGIMQVNEINHKGNAYSNRYFFNWDYWFYPEYEESLTHVDDLIDAWMPFDEKDFPSWQYIDTQESMSIIKNYPSYHEQLKINYVEKLEEKATNGKNKFILVEDCMPINEGVYVAANKEGVWLLRYDSSCNPWIAPNGKPVYAWYPVPNHY